MEEGDAPLAAAPPPPAPLCAAATAEILGIVRQAGPSHGFCVVSSGLRERVLAWCPEFERTPALLGVLSLLLFGRRCEEEGGVIVPWRTLLRFCGISRHAKLHEARKGVGIGTGLLLLYRDLCDPDLEWAEHDRRERKARVVTRDGIPDWLREGARESLRVPSRDRPVFLTTGSSAQSPGADRAILAARKSVVGPLADPKRITVNMNAAVITPPDSARVIIDYAVNCLSPVVYGARSPIPAGLDRALEIIDSDTSPFDTEQMRDQYRGMVESMKAHPQPILLACDFSPRLKTDRFNELTALPRVLRPELMGKRDILLDLDKAHMAALVCVARKEGLEMPLLSPILEGDGDLWDTFASVLLDVMPDAEALRRAVKRAYGAVFGSGEAGIRSAVVDGYREEAGGDLVAPELVQPLLEHPVMVEILATSRVLLAEIIRRGGWRRLDGSWLPLKPFQSLKGDAHAGARSLLAYICAEYEQDLIAVVYRLGAEAFDRHKAAKAAGKKKSPRRDFVVWGYIYDGVIVRVDEDKIPRGKSVRESPVVAEIQAAVRARAVELGVPTRLSIAEVGLSRK